MARARKADQNEMIATLVLMVAGLAGLVLAERAGGPSWMVEASVGYWLVWRSGK